ncbi:MAG TPA: hypothetical protein VK897_25735 [Anaerolineales bacterium]|nr:hypothetical protein [Anaerolineales bacterium]
MLCSRCVLPENYPGINFDIDGVCNFCRSYKKEVHRGAEAFERELKTLSQQSSPYTCVVPVSGGKDSTYVLYYLSQVFGLKTIAVNYDNGFTHPQAKDNLQRVTEKLGVELVTIHGFNQRKLMVGNLKSFLSKPTPAMVPLVCTGCRIGIVGSACKVARERNVDFFVMGWSRVEDTPFKSLFLAPSGSVAMGLVKNLLQNPRYLLYGSVVTQVMDYCHSYSRIRDWGSILRFLHPGIRPIAFFDFIEYDPRHIQQVVVEQVGWSCPDPKTSWQFDCQVKLVQNCLYRTLLNFTALNDYLSAQIREGYLTRPEALALLEKQNEGVHSEFDTIRTLLSNTEDLDLLRDLETFVNRSTR